MIRTVCTILFKFTGWTFVDEVPPEVRSFVMIGAPHTSNYDFIPAMAVAKLSGRNSRFVIKSEWMKFPLNFVLGPAGAIGIDRNKIRSQGSSNTTEAMAQLFKKIPDLVLMISPEGTRKANENWKTGFYYIAQKAGVPIVAGFCDYENKRAGLGLILWPDDFETDMRSISEFYRPIKGAVPENFKLDQKFLK